VHSEKYFMNYCFEDLDVYYMYLCLEASGDLDMKEFCKEGIADEYGVDSSGASAASVDEGGSSKRRRREQESVDFQLSLESSRRATMEMVATTLKAGVDTSASASTVRRNENESLTFIMQRIQAHEANVDELEAAADYVATSPSRRLIRERGWLSENERLYNEAVKRLAPPPTPAATSAAAASSTGTLTTVSTLAESV
jgi:hypothetical protein